MTVIPAVPGGLPFPPGVEFEATGWVLSAANGDALRRYLVTALVSGFHAGRLWIPAAHRPRIRWGRPGRENVTAPPAEALPVVCVGRPCVTRTVGGGQRWQLLGEAVPFRGEDQK